MCIEIPYKLAGSIISTLLLIVFLVSCSDDISSSTSIQHMISESSSSFSENDNLDNAILITSEELQKKLERFINDKIWLLGEASQLSFLVGHTFSYEYYIDTTSEEIFIIPINPATTSSETYHFFKFSFQDEHDILEDQPCWIYNVSSTQNIEQEVRGVLSGSGEIVFSQVTMPSYDIRQFDLEFADKVIETLKRDFSLSWDDPLFELHIRYYYESSESTMVLYIHEGKWYYANVSIADGRVFKPFEVDSEEFVDQFIQVAYKAV